MLKKYYSYLGILVLVCFSFYYTDLAVDVVKRNDPIMQSIMKLEDSYYIEPVEAAVNIDEIIPGYNGVKINVDESYRKMKKYNKFSENMLVFEEIVPDLTLTKRYDKYIVNGNLYKSDVSLVFKVSDIANLENIYNILLEKKISATFFVDGTVIENNMDLISDMSKDGNQIENFGYGGKYSSDMLVWTNNMITSITNSDAKYCYSEYNNNELLELCSKNKMYVVKPNILATNYPFSKVKKNLDNGSIIALEANNETLKELPAIISYINQKGYNITTLETALSEARVYDK